jgi:hypothetical protein
VNGSVSSAEYTVDPLRERKLVHNPRLVLYAATLVQGTDSLLATLPD